MNEVFEMPASAQHEKAVLSVLLNYPDKMDEAPFLTLDHFYLHRPWFQIIQSEISKSKGESVNAPDLILAARKAGIRFEDIGGYPFLSELWTYQPTATAFANHASVLSEFRARRMAVAASSALVEAATTGQIDELSEAISRPMLDIADAMTDSSPPKALKSIMEESFARFELRATGKESSIGIPLIPAIDEHLRGAHPGRMWVIASYPEGGKSVMVSQMILDAVTDGHACLLLSLEMAERDMMDRLIVQAARIDARAFTEPGAYAAENGGEAISKGLITSIRRVTPIIAKAPLRLQRPSNRKLPTIIASIRKAHREMGIKIAAVDYLQLIKGSASDNREGEISEISHAIQEVAQDLGITVIVLSQLNAEGDTKHGRVIEEDADAVICIVQDRKKDSETYKQHRHVLIAKDRHYGSGGTRVKLILDRSKIRFVYGEDATSQTSSKNVKFDRS